MPMAWAFPMNDNIGGNEPDTASTCWTKKQGQTSKEYLEIKKMAFLEPELLHAMLKSLADSIGDYANYQVGIVMSTALLLRSTLHLACFRLTFAYLLRHDLRASVETTSYHVPWYVVELRFRVCNFITTHRLWGGVTRYQVP